MRKGENFFMSYRQYRKENIFLLVACLFIVAGLGLAPTEIRADSKPIEGYNDLSKAPGINIEDPNGASKIEIPNDYSLDLYLSDETTYEPHGQVNIVQYGFNGWKPLSSKVFQFNKSNGNVSRYVWIRNAGTYQGKKIDVKFVIDEMNYQAQSRKYPYLNFLAAEKSDGKIYSGFPIVPDNTAPRKSIEELYLAIGTLEVGDGMTTLPWYTASVDQTKYHYEFFDHESGAPLVVSGIWNYKNLNKTKNIAFPYNDLATSTKSLYIYKQPLFTLGYKEYPDQGLLEIWNNQVDTGGLDTYLGQKFSGNRFGVQTRVKWTTSYSEQGTDTGTTVMLILYETESAPRLAPSEPVVIGRQNSAKHDEANYKQLQYSIIDYVGANRKVNRNTKFIIQSTVPTIYDIDLKKTKIYEYGTKDELTELFTLSYDGGNTHKLIVTAKDPTSDVFNGKTLDVQVCAVPNSTFQFDRNAAVYNYKNGGPDNGYMLFELGKSTSLYYELVEDGKVKFSNTYTSSVEKPASTAKVLYEGIPSAKPKTGLTIMKDEKIEDVYPDPATQLLEHLQVDTDNSIDEPVTVRYETKPSTAAVGPVKVVLELKTAKNVTEKVEVPLTVVKRESKVTVQFVDEMDNPLKPPVTITGEIGDPPFHLRDNLEVSSAIEMLEKDHYELIEAPENENNVSMTAAEQTFQYKFKGLLYIDSVPNEVNFGTDIKVGTGTLRIDSPVSMDGPLIVKDKRMVRKNWTLSASLAQPLTNSDGVTVIPNALRYQYKGKETILNAMAQPIYEPDRPTTEVYTISDTWSKEGDGLKFEAPAASIKKTGHYEAVILWQLTDGR